MSSSVLIAIFFVNFALLPKHLLPSSKLISNPTASTTSPINTNLKNTDKYNNNVNDRLNSHHDRLSEHLVAVRPDLVSAHFP